MSKSLLALQLLPSAMANKSLAQSSMQSDTGGAGGLAQSLLADLTAPKNAAQNAPEAPAADKNWVFGLPGSSALSKSVSSMGQGSDMLDITKPLNVPQTVANASRDAPASTASTPTVVNTPAGPKVIWEPKAAPDYSGLHNPLLDEWQKSGLLQNPNGFTHYESPDKKFPFVGPNYNKIGEEKGYWYDPYTDRYYENPNTLKGIIKDEGAAPKQPSLLSQLFPALGTMAAASGGQALGSKLVSSLFGGGASNGTDSGGSSGIFGHIFNSLLANSPAEGQGPPSLGDGFSLLGGGNDAASIDSGLLGGSPAAPLVATLLGSLLAGKAGVGQLTGAPEDNSAGGTFGRAQEGISTGGLSEVARGAKKLFGF